MKTALLVCAALLAGCTTPLPTAQAQAPAAPPAPAAAAAATPPPRVAPQPGTPAPFAEVTREAKRADGFLPVWTRDDKTWIEIPAALLDQPFFFGGSLATGLGDRGFFPGLMTRQQIAVLRRVGNTVQLLARNQHARAPAGTPLARAVAESYSDSLIGSAPLAAAPHLLNKALLVDAGLLLGNDIDGLQTQLEATYRLPYSLDRSNSGIERVRTQASGTAITVRQHFALARMPAPPPPGAAPANPAALPNPPRNVPDPRSLFVNMAYTLAPLPAQPMAARRADPRVGYFVSSYVNFGNDAQDGRRSHSIERWRLEKKDPAAAVSEPKEPIRVVLDRNVPDKWRAPLRAGVLEWNKAFERAGFRNAITLEQQPDDADWSATEGTRLLAVRWFAQDGPGSTAVGPSQSDPRTGERLRGAAIIDENRVRIFRASTGDTQQPLPPVPADFAQRLVQCMHAEDTFDDAAFAFELLNLRGDFDPQGPEADAFIAAALKQVTMHEVGHVLGLRHNFRASAGVTAAQLRDPAFTAQHGLSHSVMDYLAVNTPLQGETVTDYFMPTLGAYDYWAIAYGYREYSNADAESQALATLAALSERDPRLAYATDEDSNANDPLVGQRDMTDDPLAFAQRQFKLTRELWQRTQQRQLAAMDDMTLYRRNLQRGFAGLGAALPMALRYVGGTVNQRAMAGANQPLTTPVPAAQQRAALDVVVNEFFSSASFKFDPKFLNRLGVEQFERLRGGATADFSLPQTVLTLQRGALDTLMSEGLAARLADSESRVDDPRALPSFADVQERLSSAIWSELTSAKTGKPDIDSLRRNLQREHVRRLAQGVLRPASLAAADVHAVHRQAALQLQSWLSAALAGGRWSALVRAHLDDNLATLTEALKAPLMKQGV